MRQPLMGVQADGNLALLAAYDSGLVIVDFSNPTGPMVLSQTPLDSYDPFTPGLALPMNQAVAVAGTSKIVFVGSNGGNGIVYGFDYTEPQHPRLVSLSAQAFAINGTISSLLATGTNLFASGFTVGVTELDITQPRNTINLFYPPSALRPKPAPPGPVPATAQQKIITLSIKKAKPYSDR